MIFCLAAVAVFATGMSVGTLHAQPPPDTSSITDAAGSGNSADARFQVRKKNFDKDFLNKDKVSPWAPGFRDPLGESSLMSPLAERGLLNGIASAGSRLVAVGVKGHVLYSDDKGNKWTQAKVPVSVDLTAVYFVSPKLGWAVGHDGVVLQTTDGGTTWTKQWDGYAACRTMEKYYKEHPVAGQGPDADKLRRDIQFMIQQGPINPFLDVWFENENVGFIVGAFNLIFRTEDGGKTWEPWFDRTQNPGGYHLYCIRPIGKDIFVSGELGLLMKLDPAVKRFKEVKTPYKGTFFGIVGKPAAIVAYGMRGNIFRTTNGGAKWDKVTTTVQHAILGGMLAADGRIILVSQGGHVIVSKDDGKTFTEVKRDASLMGIPLHAVTAVDDKTLAIASWLGAQVQKIQ